VNQLNGTKINGEIEETGGHGGDLERASRQSGLHPSEILDFSSNINPLGPPPGLRAHLRRVLKEITRYPQPQARDFCSVLSDHLRVPVRKLLPGNGANDLLHLLMLWWRPPRVWVPAPSFSEYYRAARLAGAQVSYYSLPAEQPLSQAHPGEKLSRGELVVLCNPNNPTGTLYRRRQIKRLVEAAREREALVLVDESFLSLSGQPGESLQRDEYRNLWVVVSLTKCWALPGLRLGYAVGPEEEVTQLARLGDPWRLNFLSQRAGLFCLQQPGYLEKTLALVEKEKNYLRRRLHQMGCFKVYPGQANFLLVRGERPGFHAGDLYRFLLERGLLIRRADNFRGLDHRYFRLAIRRRPENRRLLKALEEYVG